MDIRTAGKYRRNVIFFLYAVIFVIVGVYFATSGGGYYNRNSPEKLEDLIQVKIWLLFAILMAMLVYSSSLTKSAKLWGWVITISFYFVVSYALFYKGTDYGLNGHWGDNGNRFALITKYRELPGIFHDWYFKDLPPFYPPLWFFLSGKLAWLFGVEGYKTIKLGYFVIYGFYPIVLFFIWGRIASKRVAFAITFLTIFLRDMHLDYVYYEHFTAAFFIPWWLYYVENVKRRKKNLVWYALGGFLGALIFLTYYYWFFIGFVSIVLRPLIRLITAKKQAWPSVGGKALMLGSVALFSSVYWAPLMISVFRFGADSMQNKWFNPAYLNFNVPFFDFNFSGLIYLIGLIYLVARFRKRLNSSFVVLLLGIVVLLSIDRICNLNEISIQTRKLRELMPVFLAVPSGFGVVLLYRTLSRRFGYSRNVILAVFAVFVFFVGTTHSDVTSSDMYRIAINSRVPTDDISVFKSVDFKGKVFLTNHYLEAAYLPYYMFVCPNSATAHTASRYHKRITFLQYVGKLDDEAQVAYLLKRNCLDKVDYFYLPVDEKKGVTYYDMYPLYFPGKNVKLHLEFPFKTTIDSRYFVSRHTRGLYEVYLPERSVVDIFVGGRKSADVRGSVEELERLNLAMQFLPQEYSDSLKPYVQDMKTGIRQFTDSGSLFRFDRGIQLIDFTVIGDSADFRSLQLVFLSSEQVSENYRIFIHAYPEDSTLLEESDRSKRFKNLDLVPHPAISQWVNGEHQFLKKKIVLKAGRYKFHVGFFNRESGRLPKTYWTDYISVGLENNGRQNVDSGV